MSGGIMARADKLVGQKFPFLTRAQVHEAFALKLVSHVNGRSLSKGDKVEPSDILFEKLESLLSALGSGNSGLDVLILHEDEELWVVKKPAGLATHSLRLSDTDTIVQWAFAREPALKMRFPSPLSEICPHRLDTGTEGVLIVAKHVKTYLQWREYFSKGKVKKKYWAWVWGVPSSTEFECHSNIAHHPSDIGTMIATSTGKPFHPPVLPASSFVRVLKRSVPVKKSLVEVLCTTGVTHQVRVHLAALGFPLVGDRRYDDEKKRNEPYLHHFLLAVELQVESIDRKWTLASDDFERLF